MKEILTMTDLAQIRASAETTQKFQLLIVSSRQCPWCVRFKDLWEEVEEQLASAYDVFIMDVINVGGPDLFAEAAPPFLPFPIELPMGYPTLYRVTSVDEVESVPTHVFWDAPSREFLQSNLVSYLLNGGAP